VVALRLNKSKLENRMKPVLIFTMLLLLAGCASQTENPQNTGPTKAEVQARDEFAKSLPKPPER
jgi:outer membrane biogenesis lipoprotein LolB